jgi:hypothetical protein
MKIEENNKIETGLFSFPTYITIANLVILLTIAYRVGGAQESMEGHIQNNKEHIIELEKVQIEHQTTQYMHRPMEDLMIQFVPRAELQSKLDAIIESQKEIKTLMNDK